jgi:hypothetical protein
MKSGSRVEESGMSEKEWKKSERSGKRVEREWKKSERRVKGEKHTFKEYI